MHTHTLHTLSAMGRFDPGLSTDQIVVPASASMVTPDSTEYRVHACDDDDDDDNDEYL